MSNSSTNTAEDVAEVASENPFYNMRETLALYRLLPKQGDDPSKSVISLLLHKSWEECKTKEQKELFFCIVFSVGDIQNREHNLFRKRNMKDVPGGGHSKRKVFLYCLEWILQNVTGQFYAFLPIIGEYYNLDGLMFYELRTDRWEGQLKETLKLPINVDLITDYIGDTLRQAKLTVNESKLWARWLPHIPCSKRRRRYIMTEKNLPKFLGRYPDAKVGEHRTISKPKQDYTIEKDKWTLDFITKLSKKVGWEVVTHKSNLEFVGYKKFRSKFLEETEAHLFSSHGIKKKDKVQLTEWFNQLPAGARYRVTRKLLSKDKLGTMSSRGKWVNEFGDDIGTVFMEWMKIKEDAQKQMRSMTEEQKKEMSTEDFKKLSRTAKVNTGANTILDSVTRFFSNKITEVEANMELHSMADMMVMNVPVLPIADVSTSMREHGTTHNEIDMARTDLCKLILTLVMYKNPEPELAGMFVRFDNIGEVVAAGQRVEINSGKFTMPVHVVVDKLIDKTESFLDNYNRISKYVITRGTTSLSAVSHALKVWLDADKTFEAQKIEHVNKYPVWLVISDGDLNSHGNAKQSMKHFQEDMQRWFGWNGVVVLWDVKDVDQEPATFEGLANVVHLSGFNLSNVSQVFTSIDELKPIDVYTVLQSFHKSNRYLPVKELIL